MGVTKKIALATLVYVGYQLLTNKKYDSLRKDILKEYEKAKPSIISTLDDVHMYLTIPKDVSDETTRIRIDNEIELIKEKIRNINPTKMADKTNKIITVVSDSVSKSLTNLKKKK
jgi:hypothetical protein